MAACSNCGSPNAADARFCTGCGRPLTPPTVAPAPAPTAAGAICPTCGISLPPGVKFCAKCGGTVPMKTPAAPPPGPPRPMAPPPAPPPPAAPAPPAPVPESKPAAGGSGTAPGPPPFAFPSGPAPAVPPPYKPPMAGAAPPVPPPYGRPGAGPAAFPPAKKKSGLGIVLLIAGLVVVLGGGGYFGYTRWRAARKAAQDAAIAQTAPPATAPPLTPLPTPIPSPETTPEVTPPQPPTPTPPAPTPLPTPPANSPVQPGSPGAGATLPEGPVSAHPAVVKKVKPVYPKLARDSHLGGVVRVQVIITADGHVREATLVSGNAVLGQAAVDAVKKWVYEPTLVNGRPVEATTVVQFRFNPD